MRPRRTRRSIAPAHDVDPELVPPIPLVVLNAKIVVAAAERGEVERGLVRLTVVDDQRTIDPHADSVIAESAKSVLAWREIHRARRLEREILPRQIRDRAVSLVIQTRNVRGENRWAYHQRSHRVGSLSGVAGAVAPFEEPRSPVDRRLETAVRKRVRNAPGQHDAPRGRRRCPGVFERQLPVAKRVWLWRNHNRIANGSACRRYRSDSAP